MDAALQLTHPRSDLSSWFVQGGSATLTKLFKARELRGVTAGADDFGLVQKILAEMMPVLQSGLPKPEMKISNSPRAGWLGRDTWRITYDTKTQQTGWSDTTVIEVQKSIVGNEETLRRVIAHELCHHEDSLVNEKPELERLGFPTYRRLRSGTGHGAKWKAIAAKFNARYGADFVTEKSDQSYSQEQFGPRAVPHPAEAVHRRHARLRGQLPHDRQGQEVP